MKCAVCQQAGVKSRVEILGTSSTLMSFAHFYDEEGRYHSHDPNRHTTSYRCSNGHSWTISTTMPCPEPTCGFGKPGGPQ